MTTSHRLSWIAAILGLWQLLSPFILGYSGTMVALWNAVIVGIVLIVLGVWSALSSSATTTRALDWINFLVGLWLIVSPFLLAFTGISIAFWDAVIVGIVVAVIDLVAALAVRSVETVPPPTP
ncbi:MAG: SPW repeat protein [Omnitrophica WOR_2 bacterium]